MNNIEILTLTVITQNQSQKRKAEALAQMILSDWSIDGNFLIEKYYKFDNSYQIVICFSEKRENTLDRIFELTALICTPWIVSYDIVNHTFHYFIFDCNTHSAHFTRNIYNTIRWASIDFSWSSDKEL